MGEDFLLDTPEAIRLYHEFAAGLPIVDYHNHLPPELVADDHRFANLTQVWLQGDHYKWRVMRANGVSEHFITGDSSDEEKFLAWADTVPWTVRNPLYHWTHLELRRYFDIGERLDPDNARSIYSRCNDRLAESGHRVGGLLAQRNVEWMCTTDDPVDDLAHHRRLHAEQGQVPDHPVRARMYPTFRPDKAIRIDQPQFPKYVADLSAAAGMPVGTWEELLEALRRRIDYFHAHGCRLSDHGLERLPDGDFTEIHADIALRHRLKGEPLEPSAVAQYQSALLHFLGREYHRKGWVQQFHLGALRNQNSRLLRRLGTDAGVDSIGDFSQAVPLGRFLDRLDREDVLTKTILYNLRTADNEVFATMAGNFNDGSVPGKVQYGAAWWYLDQLDGMEKQLDTLSNTGLLGRFVGMLTDSRSFLSFPRHEYFRRLLCRTIGRDMQQGLLPHDMEWLGTLVGRICYHNAKEYFRLGQPG
ncbi:MAG: hypothetical protein RLY31_1155 [Bacteroidota bacterium]